MYLFLLPPLLCFIFLVPTISIVFDSLLFGTFLPLVANMYNVPFGADEGSDPVPLAILLPSHSESILTATEDGGFPTMEEIVPHNPDIRSDFSKMPEAEPGTFKSVMTEADLS